MTVFAAFLLSFGSVFAVLRIGLPSFSSDREAERMLALVQSQRTDRRHLRGKEGAQNSLRKLLAPFGNLLGVGKVNPRQRRRLQQAGLGLERIGAFFYLVEFACGGVGVFLGSLLPENTYFWMAVGGLVGYMAPGAWVTAKVGAFQKRLRRSIPDALDLLVICVDAGLGLDQALLRMREELSVSQIELAAELERLNTELRAGLPRVEAWRNMAERTGVEEFSALTSILAETERFGTPIVKALSTYSEELRLIRRQHAEEAAAKTKIKIVFPLVICIFPCIFIVLLAPALLGLLDGLKNVGH